MTFVIPSKPTPRERYRAHPEPFQGRPGTWKQTHVTVVEAQNWNGEPEDQRVVGSYDRNYRMMKTFEPFRQGDKDFALVSPNYTATAVMDLQTGKIIAGEEPDAMGFCPVGFYVPDWWDVHYDPGEELNEDPDYLPGGQYWTEDDEWPVGDLGFVWGCHWGDDTSWKIQCLDLSLVQQGEIERDDRFGYVEVDASGDPTHFIRIYPESPRRVTFSVLARYNLDTGKKR